MKVQPRSAVLCFFPIHLTQTHTHILTLHVLCYFYRLSLCEKALAEYLDTKRLAFPRFYFISSADLLDILSNGTNPHQVASQIYAQGMAVNLMLQSVHTDEKKTVLTFSALSTIYFTNSFLKLCSIVSLGFWLTAAEFCSTFSAHTGAMVLIVLYVTPTSIMSALGFFCPQKNK